MEQNNFVILGLRDKRAAVAGWIIDLCREMDKKQADLLHLDTVLKLFGLEPAEMPNKECMPVRSAYFGRNEISHRCRDMLREKGTVRAGEISVQTMKDKGLDPEVVRKTRTGFQPPDSGFPARPDEGQRVGEIWHRHGVVWRLR